MKGYYRKLRNDPSAALPPQRLEQLIEQLERLRSHEAAYLLGRLMVAAERACTTFADQHPAAVDALRAELEHTRERLATEPNLLSRDG